MARPDALRWRLRTLFAAIAVCSAASCGGSGSTGPGLPDISGAWHLSSTLTNNAAITCQITGDVSISQSGDAFTGQVSGSQLECFSTTVGDSTNEGNVDGPFTDGSIAHNGSMSFSRSGCYYNGGIIVTDPTPVVYGTGGAFCNIVYKGDSSRFNGGWGLNR